MGSRGQSKIFYLNGLKPDTHLASYEGHTAGFIAVIFARESPCFQLRKSSFLS